MEKFRQPKVEPSEAKLMLLRAAAHDVSKEIEVVQNANIQAELEIDREMNVINEITQALAIAREFQEARDLYIAVSAILSGDPTVANSSSYTALRQLSIEEAKRRDGLSIQINATEQELEARQLALQISQESMQSRHELLVTLKRGLSRIMSERYRLKTLPAECWAQIFQHRVFSDVDDYLEGSMTSLPHTALTLSHVCPSWMSLVRNTSNLWRDLKAYPETDWTRGRIELFNHYLSHSKESLLEIYVEMRSEPRDGCLYPFLIRTLNIPCAYNIHFMRRPMEAIALKGPLPFRTPKSTSVHNFASDRMRSYELKSLLDTWLLDTCLVSRINIHGPYDCVIHLGPFPQGLTHLTLDPPERISSVRLATYFKSIVELRLKNDEFTVHPDPTGEITLPSLKVLGILLTHQQITRLLRLPALQTMIFYPTSRSLHLSEDSLDAFASLTSRAKKFHFSGWPKWSYNFPSNSAAAFAIEMCKRSTQFTSIEFSNGFVDGSFLCEHRDSLISGRKDSGRVVEDIHFTDCTGVTRADCEQLSKVVGRIRVSM
ncbi:hypothetical protein FRC18_002623 [Serendipita sp. 400]|nr:hypothetical protein FRC18_002623 [Serendipita sp. 400]